VRSIAIDTLGRLYRRTDGHVDRALLELLFLRLGDEHSLVRQSARRLIRVLAPPEEVLLQSSIGRLAAPNARDRLEGLLACGELVRADHAFARRVDRDARDRLVTDDDETVRAEAVHLLGVLDDGRAAIWARALADGAPAVRVEALKAIRLLSAPPEVSTVVPLLRDPDEAVRLETLYTIGQLGGVDLATLEPALSDPSADVREAVSRFFRARSD
jgi:HEAT repeat protein